MSWLLKIFFFLLMWTFLRWLWSRAFGLANQRSQIHQRSRSAKQRGTIRGQTVKDPQCGMYVATDLAIKTTRKGRILYFCSEECRDKYIP